MKPLTWVGCCLAAAAGACGLPTLELAWIAHRGSDPGDDAPWRASMVLLLLMPAFFALAALYFGVLAAMLSSLRRLSLRWLLLAQLPLCFAVATRFAWQGYELFGARDALISFGGIGASAMMCLSLGSVSWWAARSLAERGTASGS